MMMIIIMIVMMIKRCLWVMRTRFYKERIKMFMFTLFIKLAEEYEYTKNKTDLFY